MWQSKMFSINSIQFTYYSVVRLTTEAFRTSLVTNFPCEFAESLFLVCRVSYFEYGFTSNSHRIFLLLIIPNNFLTHKIPLCYQCYITRPNHTTKEAILFYPIFLTNQVTKASRLLTIS